MEGSCPSNHSHGSQVNGVLDRCHLEEPFMSAHLQWVVDCEGLRGEGCKEGSPTIKLLTMICKIFALKLVRPEKTRWRI